jgi:hypothetical protein
MGSVASPGRHRGLLVVHWRGSCHLALLSGLTAVGPVWLRHATWDEGCPHACPTNHTAQMDLVGASAQLSVNLDPDAKTRIEACIARHACLELLALPPMTSWRVYHVA